MFIKTVPNWNLAARGAAAGAGPRAPAQPCPGVGGDQNPRLSGANGLSVWCDAARDGRAGDGRVAVCASMTAVVISHEQKSACCRWAPEASGPASASTCRSVAWP